MTGGTIEWFDHPGLFMVRLDEGRGTVPAPAGAGVVRKPRPAPGQDTRENALYRYCSGCSRETEHVQVPTGGPTNIPTMQWPLAKPATATTICRACGEWRAAASRPNPLTWSSWPRKLDDLAAARNGAPTEAESAPELDGRDAEAAAENEGMPPAPERRRRRAFRPGGRGRGRLLAARLK